MKQYEHIVEDCQEQVARGASQEDIIANLHAQGVNIIESMRVIREVYGVGLGDAKRIVTAHPVWTPLVQHWDPIHAALIEELAKEAKGRSYD